MRLIREKRKEICLKKWGKNYTDELKDHFPELNDPEIHLK